ncbi:MAG: DMT family transporter [Desulfobacteraceae bacterium]|jgi:drug/metabolite transporter (DMT)-like permease
MMRSLNVIHKGIVLILVATLGIVLMNTCAKMSSNNHGPIEMVFYRGVVALLILTPYMLLTRPKSIFRTERVLHHLYRAIVGNMGVAFVFWAYSLLPMADATALLFSAPLFVALLSPLLLKEKVNDRRWIAILIGFIGIILIARPSETFIFRLSSLVGLAAALCNALVDMALRDLGQTDDPLTTVFFFLLLGVIFSAPYTLLYGEIPLLENIPWIIGIGFFAAIQQVAKTTAYRYAEASLLAPYTYSSIIFAAIIGWLFWKDIPSFPVVAGTLLIIVSNLFIVRKEWLAASQKM